MMDYSQKILCIFNTVIENGKHRGKKIEEVYSCEEILENIPVLIERHPEIDRALQELESSKKEDEEYNDYDDWDEDDSPTYSRYSGTYAQDEMGFSDEDIDELFDGDPDYAWNLD